MLSMLRCSGTRCRQHWSGPGLPFSTSDRLVTAEMTETVLQSLAGAFFPSASLPSADTHDPDGTLTSYMRLSGASIENLPVHVRLADGTAQPLVL